MDVPLFQYIQTKQPKMNETILHGIAYKQLKDADIWLECVLRCAANRFPPIVRFERLERCTPEETYATLSAKRGSNKVRYQHAKSDFTLYKIYYSYMGEELKPVYTFCPFARIGGIIHIKGSRFVISPVLIDPAMSVDEDEIYVPMTQDKLNIFRETLLYVRDGYIKTGDVVWCNAHHMKGKKTDPLQRKTVNANCSLAHYLFSKYGFYQTFKKYTNTEVHVGYADTINLDNYPHDEWSIVSSIRQQPLGYKAGNYQTNEILIAVKRDAFEKDKLVENLIIGFYYVADLFPQRMHLDYLDDVRLWRVLLGRIVFANDEVDHKLLTKIDSHINSLDGYMDYIVQQDWLKVYQVNLENVYDMFVFILRKFVDLMTQGVKDIPSMYGKRYTVLRYVLSSMVYAINKTMFDLNNAYNSKKGLSKQDCVTILSRYVKRESAMRINHKHGEVASINSPSDNMAFKITAMTIMQTNLTSGNPNNQTTRIALRQILHASIAECGQFSNHPKSDATGRSRINPFCHLEPDGTILRSEELRPIIDKTQAYLDK